MTFVPFICLSIPLGLAWGFWGTWNSHPLGEKADSQEHAGAYFGGFTACETGESKPQRAGAVVVGNYNLQFLRHARPLGARCPPPTGRLVTFIRADDQEVEGAMCGGGNVMSLSFLPLCGHCVSTGRLGVPLDISSALWSGVCV